MLAVSDESASMMSGGRARVQPDGSIVMLLPSTEECHPATDVRHQVGDNMIVETSITTASRQAS
jgi:hypothetical protein